MRELTDNDKQRIEQEAAKLFNRWDGGLVNVQTMLLSIAEYATLYERQQFREQLESLIVSRNEMMKLYKVEIDRLEAERSEVRNKVIEEAIGHLNSPLLNFSDGLIYKETVIDLLNSLKTKTMKKHTYPKYETCDLMHNGVCVSTPCICKGMAMSKKRKDTKAKKIKTK